MEGLLSMIQSLGSDLAENNILSGAFYFALGLLVRSLPRFFREKRRIRNDKEMAQRLEKRPAGVPSAPAMSSLAVKDFWRTTDEQAHITAVVSGKGGVGKSSISLGLMEYHSRKDRVLLVDFDLHNRGLTSMFNGIWSQEHQARPTTVLTEMERFQAKVLPGLAKAIGREPGDVALSDVDHQSFIQSRNDFCYQDITLGLVRDLNLSDLPPGKPTKSDVRPEACFFLPGRRYDKSFLRSPVFGLSISGIAIFLKYLACWAAKKHQIRQIVLDCHGAQDLFMVGAAVACDHLVLVTKPEPGAFEGTLELIEFSRSLKETQRFVPRSEILLLNEFRNADRNTAEILLGKAGRSIEDTPTVPADDGIRDLFKSYRNPSVVNEKHLWRKIEIIAESQTLRPGPAKGSPLQESASRDDLSGKAALQNPTTGSEPASISADLIPGSSEVPSEKKTLNNRTESQNTATPDGPTPTLRDSTGR